MDRVVPHQTAKAIDRLHGAHALASLVGSAPAFVRAVATVANCARGDASVVITGETGTGKELVARALHYAGPRGAHPFVAVNCGALPDALLEDELFGHERGAFTDARSARDGLLVQAERGTLFLDEVDSLSPRAQVALLRVLQDRTYRSLGSPRERKADVRFVAATNTPLATLVQRGTFRVDLYYRLSVLLIELPPLRDRAEDVLPLARHFLAKHARDGDAPSRLSGAAERALLAHAWPGNVRELENVMLRALSLASSDRITAGDLGIGARYSEESSDAVVLPDGAGMGGAMAFRDAKRAAVDAFERAYLTNLLREHNGNVSSAARAAQTERHDLRRLLRKHCLDRGHFIATGEEMMEDSSPT